MLGSGFGALPTSPSSSSRYCIYYFQRSSVTGDDLGLRLVLLLLCTASRLDCATYRSAVVAVRSVCCYVVCCAAQATTLASSSTLTEVLLLYLTAATGGRC